MIFLLCGWVFLYVETSAAGTLDPNPETAIRLTPRVFFFASVMITVVGLLVGAIEMIILPNAFRKQSFYRKIIYKSFMYLIFILIIMSFAFPIAASLEAETHILDPVVWEKFIRFIGSNTFLSTMVQLAFSILLSLIYAEVSENLGHSVMVNFFTGKYHKPKEEGRIFMFLDMRSSTTLAEQLGHIRYFELLSEYYSDLSESIIRHYGQVYQYIGDEIVITWTYEKGLENDNCLRCFFAMRKALANRNTYYKDKFGVIPSFKGGLHLGEVTTGEIGALKKEIIFTGDVLNATARLQGLCKTYEADLLISSELKGKISEPGIFTFRDLGQIHLSGRKEPMQIYSVDRND